MKGSLYIGESPPEETCVGIEAGEDKMRAECKRYIVSIRKFCGPEPDGARLYVKANPHDFGTYYSVECEYDPDKPESVAYAFRVESDGPSRWVETLLTDGTSGKKTVRYTNGELVELEAY